MSVKFERKWNKAINNLHKPFDKFAKECLAGQVNAVREATFLIHETAVQSLQDNTDGKPQIRYAPKRVVNVSKPGDPPNTDTGRAVQSIKMDFMKEGLIGRVGTNLRYLRMLEFGTNIMEPRPWLSAAIAFASKQIAEIFARNFRKTIKEVTP